MTYDQLSKMAGSMMTWGHMIWIFFPIPVFCLILLSMPSYRRIERVGTKLVGKIFFTRISVGPLYIRLVYVFIGASLLIFGVACRSIQMGFGSAHVPCSGWVLTAVMFCFLFALFRITSIYTLLSIFLLHMNNQNIMPISYWWNNVVSSCISL